MSRFGVNKGQTAQAFRKAGEVWWAADVAKHRQNGEFPLFLGPLNIFELKVFGLLQHFAPLLEVYLRQYVQVLDQLLLLFDQKQF